MAHAGALRDDYADAINNAGIVLQELGRTSEAAELYRRLLERMPDYAEAHNNRGTALLAEGRPDDARASFELALAHRSDFPEAFYNLGNAWRETGHLAAAIAAYRKRIAPAARLFRRVQPTRLPSRAGLRLVGL